MSILSSSNDQYNSASYIWIYINRLVSTPKLMKEIKYQGVLTIP